MSETHTTNPAPDGPHPTRPASRIRTPAEIAALELAMADRMAAIGMDLLHGLRLEVLDWDNAPTCFPGERIQAKDAPLGYVRASRTVRMSLAARARIVAASDQTGLTAEAAAEELQRQIQMVTDMSCIGMDLLEALDLEVVDPRHAPTAMPGCRVGAGDPALAHDRICRAIRLNFAIRARLAEGSLGTGRKVRAETSKRPGAAEMAASPPEAAERAGSPDAARFQARAGHDADQEAARTEREDLNEPEGVETESDESLADADEFACFDGLSVADGLELARREFERCVGAGERPRGPAAAARPDDPPRPGGPAEMLDPVGAEPAGAAPPGRVFPPIRSVLPFQPIAARNDHTGPAGADPPKPATAPPLPPG